MKNKFTEKLIGIAKKHFQKEIFPKFQQVLGVDINNVLVFIEGSVAHGFADKLSDVDVSVLFLKDLPAEKMNELNPIFKDYWTNNVRITYMNEERNKERVLKILNGNIAEIWDNPSIYFFFETKNYYPVYDQNNVLSSIQKLINFYPEDFAKQVIRGFWITANNSGLYEVEQCIARKKNTEGYIAFYKGLEAAIRLIYVLNKEYFPPTKWLTTGLKNIEDNFGVKGFLAKIKGNNLKKDYKDYGLFLSKIKKFMEDNKTIEQESIENCYNIFKNNLSWHVFSTF